MTLDHARVRAASRRAGATFTLAERRRPVVRRPTAKLTRADVTAIRSWSKAEGFGYPRKAQARALASRFPQVAAQTLYDVLANTSWFDPSYDASQPDPTFWAGATPLRLTLHVLELFHPRSSVAGG